MMEMLAAIRANPVIIIVYPPPGMNVLTDPR
jgi:hypothetical protein